jgi:universal stress protein E
MKHFRNMLCVVEPEEENISAMERAVTLAENNQAKLTVVSVIERITAGIGLPDGGPISAELQTKMAQAQRQKLESLVADYRKRVDIQLNVLQGTPFLEIIREVLNNNYDLVVKAPENIEWQERVFGSNDMHLLRKCPCPVWIIKPEAPKSYRYILAAVDIGEDQQVDIDTQHTLNLQILEKAMSLAISEFAELHIVHVWNAVGESAMRGGFLKRPEEQVATYVEQIRQVRERGINSLLQQVTEKLGRDTLDYLKPKIQLVKGFARKEIPELAKQINADLVVMGTVARTGIPGFIIGNTAESILNQIDCSVLAMKPPGFMTPVTTVD